MGLLRRKTSHLAIAASSAPIPKEKWSKVAAKTIGGDDSWQDEVWAMYDLVGEFAFAVEWKKAAMSQCRLIASDVDPETGIPTGTTENLEARALVAAIGGGVMGQSEMLGQFGALLSVPGDSYLAVLHDGPTEEWFVVSRDEVGRVNGVSIELPDGTKRKLNEDEDSLIRVWNRHPRKASLATSSAKAALPTLREIVRMSQNIEAAGKSRQAGNGILILPEEISMPNPKAPTGYDPDAPNLPESYEPAEFVTASDIQTALQKVMAAAIADPSSAEALVPILLQVKGEFIDKIRHITFASELTRESREIRKEAVQRLAMSLDLPAEVLLGFGDVNHWNSFVIDATGIRLHVKDDMQTVCEALTKNLLRPSIDDKNIVVWFDVTAAEADPKKDEKTANAYTAGVIDRNGYARELGVSEDDLYDDGDKGWKEWARDALRREPALMPVLGPYLKLIEAAPESSPAPPKVDAEGTVTEKVAGDLTPPTGAVPPTDDTVGV